MLNIHFNINICLIWIAYRSGGHIFTVRLFFSSDWNMVRWVNKEFCAIFAFVLFSVCSRHFCSGCQRNYEFLFNFNPYTCACVNILTSQPSLTLFLNGFQWKPIVIVRAIYLFIWIGNLKGDNLQVLYAYEYAKTINV